MKKLVLLSGLAIFLVVSSCDTTNTEAELQDDLTLKAAQKVLNFRAHLSGDQEVPARETNATGQAIFQLSKDGNELSYKLIVANIENVTASHIHLGQAGTNAGFVAFLAGNFSAGGGRTDGVLAEGVITSANLVGSLAGQSLSVLVAHMYNGNAYVNVHTNDGVSPTNTGPGDFPGGEIRGQISGNMPASMN